MQQKILRRDALRTLLAAKIGRFLVVAIIAAVISMLFCQPIPLAGQTFPNQNHIYQITESGLDIRTGPMPATLALYKVLKAQNQPSNISAIIRLIQLAKVKDINFDGLVNCIDFSITFRNLYGDMATLIINRNPNTGMNHMFVRVWDGTSIIDIEPQGKPNNYSMGGNWSMVYDPAYNTDVTSIWGGYSGY